MKKTERQLLTDAFKGLISRLEKSEKFVLAQAPDICKQMITDKMLSLIQEATVIALVFISGVALILCVWSHNFFVVSEGYHNGELNVYGGLAFLGLFVAGIGFFWALDIVRRIFYIKRCTKLFLLRNLKELVK